MICIDRGPEPPALQRARYTHLARAIQAHARGDTPEVRTGYEAAREPLHTAQEFKCAYCEAQIQQPSLPVEHFRPKAKAIRGDGSEAPGYWWLAWTWENLLFSCATCNGSARKGNHFGLEPHSVALCPLQHPPGQELASFIDPGREDPLDHIEFRKLGPHWQPTPRGGSPRGRYTIDKLGLDRGALLDFYNDHVRTRVQPALDKVRAASRTADPKAITRAWSRCERVLFGSCVPFQALSHDVLAAALPLAERKRWRLELRRPGRRGQPGPASDHAPPGLDALTPSLALEVRALGPSPGESRLPVLRAVRDAHPDWTESELATLFEVTKPIIQADLRALASSDASGD